LWPPDPYKDQSRPVANQLRPEPVKTGLVTAKDCKRPVCCSSVWFFEVSRIGRTSYGYGLRHWALKDQTGPDFQTLWIIAMEVCVHDGIFGCMSKHAGETS